MGIDWNLYKDLERQEHEINAANPVTVKYTYDEFLQMAHGLLLLRRVQGNSGDQDLGIVDRCITPGVTRIREAFNANPGTEELRAERARMLQDNERGEDHGTT
jgi:hypothetical protein